MPSLYKAENEKLIFFKPVLKKIIYGWTTCMLHFTQHILFFADDQVVLWNSEHIRIKIVKDKRDMTEQVSSFTYTHFDVTYGRNKDVDIKLNK